MSAPIPLRQDFEASQLRGLARRSKDGPQARPLAVSTVASILSVASGSDLKDLPRHRTCACTPAPDGRAEGNRFPSRAFQYSAGRARSRSPAPACGGGAAGLSERRSDCGWR